MALFTTKAAADPTVTEGSISSGDYTATQVSNNTRLIIIDSTGSSANKYKVDLNFDGVAPAVQWDDAVGVSEPEITSIEIILEARDTISTDDYYLLMWNFNSSAWDEVGAVMSIGGTEASFTRNIVANFEDYVSSDELKVRIANGKALGKGGAPNNNGQLEIDHFEINITNAVSKIKTGNTVAIASIKTIDTVV